MNGTVAWQKALQLEKESRAKAGEVASLDEDAAGAPLREWWGRASDAVRLFRVALERGFVPDPPPLGLLDILADMADTIAAGKIPSSIKFAASKGGKPAMPDEGRLIATACAYLHAAGDGLVYAGSPVSIDDKTPIETVCAAYGVDHKTAYKWKGKFQPGSLALFLGPKPVSPAALTGFMREAGARYKVEYALWRPRE
jgi:hypothetical protein